MYDALSYTEVDGQHAELLPNRTVLSTFSLGGDGGVIVESSCENAAGQAAGLLSTGGVLASQGCQPTFVAAR